MFQTCQRYNFESKSQPGLSRGYLYRRCFRPAKDTILRANHNELDFDEVNKEGVSDLPKIQFWEQITTRSFTSFVVNRCFRPAKDTILRANHNTTEYTIKLQVGVSDLPKIQFWEQITTKRYLVTIITLVFQTCQRYNFESKSQHVRHDKHRLKGVSDLPKIQFWEQITTIYIILSINTGVFQTCQRYNFESKSQLALCWSPGGWGCFRPAKDTILRANHNSYEVPSKKEIGVSDLPKIQFWEQITTLDEFGTFESLVFQTCQRYNFESKSQLLKLSVLFTFWCFRPAKDTILRANHNKNVTIFWINGVFQTYQRYNFESKSQLTTCCCCVQGRCFRPIKDTILRANHNIFECFC